MSTSAADLGTLASSKPESDTSMDTNMPPPSADSGSPKTISRPSTPPLTRLPQSSDPRTPEPPSRSTTTKLQPPRTPSSGTESPHPASVYLSSPIRRNKHSNWLIAGTMTPGRPSLKHSTGAGIASSPFRASRPAGGSGATATGPVNLETPSSMPTLPLQTLLMTADQAREIKDLDTARDTLVLAIEQCEQFRKAAQQFRSLANHHAFQHKLVQIERDESEQRYRVEANMQKREIEKLVVDIMGYNDKSIDTDQIRRRLKRTKQRLREMEELVVTKDRQLAELQTIIAHYARLQSMPMAPSHFGQPGTLSAIPSVVSIPPLPPQPAQQHHSNHSHSHNPQQSPTASASASPEHKDKPRPPPIDTQASAASSPSSATTEPLSALEVLASQVLSSGIQHPDGTSGSETQSSSGGSDGVQQLPTVHPTVGAPTGYGSSPYSSPFYAPFSPFAVPPQYTRPPPTSVPQFGSPEKRRRPSSSSTISAMSEEDTLEEIRNE